MKNSVDQRMESAMAFFAARASETKTIERRLLFEHLRELAEATQQNTRMLDVLKREIEQFHLTR